METKMNLTLEVELSRICINAYIEYWEDAYVNGMEDDNENPSIPCVDSSKYYWQPIINIETGEVLNWKKGITAKTNYKVRDEFSCDFLDNKEETVKSYEGYVPEFMYPGEKGFGDYIMLTIDKDGYIKNWDKNLVVKFFQEIG